MASILGLEKFVRYFASLARNLAINTHRKTDGNLTKHSQTFSITFAHGFASIRRNDRNSSRSIEILRNDRHLDRTIRNVDQHIRRTGRIRSYNIEEVLNEIRSHRTASSSQCLQLLRFCENLFPDELPETCIDLVQQIWQTLTNLKIPMDVSHFNALLRVYLESEHTFSPTEFLSDLESNGVEPNRVTYQLLITHYCRNGDIDGATTILEIMKAKQFPINDRIFNALIMGYSEAGDLDSAVGILSTMNESGVEPSSDTFTVMLCAYAKHGKIDDIVVTLDKCETSGIYLSDRDLFDIIYHLATNGHHDHVYKIIRRLRKSPEYNQNAMNVILRLVNKGQIDFGYEILKTMPRSTKPFGELTDSGAFFIKRMVKTKCPAKKILSICKELQEGGLNNRATLIALETAATSGIVDIVVPFLKAVRESGLPIRPHYFWPLLCVQGKINSNAVLEVLRLMQTEFRMDPSGETMRDYVLPFLREHNYENIISMLRSTGISISNAAESCVYDALIQFKIQDAASLASMYSIYYQPRLFRRPLLEALKKTSDYRSYASILHSMYVNLPRYQQLRSPVTADEEDNYSETQIQSKMLGEFVISAVYHLKNCAGAAHQILSALIERGLFMSNVHAERIKELLGSSLTPEISTILNKNPVELLEKMIQRNDANGENASELIQTLLLAYCKDDVKKSEELLAKLEATDFVVTSRIYAYLVELYCNNNALEKALAIHAKIMTNEPDFVLDDFKTIKIVQQLVVNDRIDEAIKFLNFGKTADKSTGGRSFAYSALCLQILNLLADKGKDTDLTKIFNAMDENHFIEINNALLGPLVKVHLVNNDIQKAMETFETISTKYRCTPFHNRLACKLIQLADAANLKLLTDLSSNVHGKVKSHWDLAFAFIESGQIQRARNLLQTPLLRNRSQFFNDACEWYRRQGKAATLEALVEATRDLNCFIDRHAIFDNLLLTYCKEDNPKKAFDLWTKIQGEKNVIPSDQFRKKLATYLTEKGWELPFALLEQMESNQHKSANSKKVLGSCSVKETKADDQFKSNRVLSLKRDSWK